MVRPRTSSRRPPARRASRGGRLTLVAGPSGVGKTPLVRALAQMVPELSERMRCVQAYVSRSARPGEQDGVDYHFRNRTALLRMRTNPRYLVREVRNDVHAVDLEELVGFLKQGDACYEGNPDVALALLDHPQLAEFEKLSVFVAPISQAEIGMLQQHGVKLGPILAHLMRNKLLRRAERKQMQMDRAFFADADLRARSALAELNLAHRFDFVLVNHDGEDSDHWDIAPEPLGEARVTVQALASLLGGILPESAERWPEHFPDG